MALQGLELLRLFVGLKKVDKMISEETRATRSGYGGDAMVARKEALDYARKESRRQEKISRSRDNFTAQAQSFQIQQAAQRNAALARETNRRDRPAPGRNAGVGIPRTTARVEKSDMERLNYMEHAEEIKNKFPREVLAAQEKQREFERNLADKWRGWAAQDEHLYGGTQYPRGSVSDYYGAEAPTSRPYQPYNPAFEGLPGPMEPLGEDYRIPELDLMPTYGLDEGGE